jgi:dihydroxyacid dehydratase/phosphogluconate dehydratase
MASESGGSPPALGPECPRGAAPGAHQIQSTAARSPLSGLAAELAAAPAPDGRVVRPASSPSIRPAVWSLLKGNLCLAGALLKIAGLKAHAFA